MKNEFHQFDDSDYQLRFGGVARLYGQKGLKQLLNSHVLLVGLGGVGTWAAESLARSGIGAITLVDLDDICITNTNRQIHAHSPWFGTKKVKAIADRIFSINPQCKVRALEEFFTTQTIDLILDLKYDFVIDAIDSLNNKCLLVAKCQEKNIPLIITGAAAGKRNPSLIRIDDLGLATHDPLLFSLRKKLRQEYSFPSGANFTRSKKQIFNISCVYSPEAPVFYTSDGGICFDPAPKTNLKLDCQTGMGSVTHTTGIFGFMAASFVINCLTGDKS